MKILAIDTSAESSSVALLYDESIGAEFCFNTKRRHEETLLEAIEALLSQGGVKPSEIDLFAVTVGPGSFTGIRVGLSTMKGFAFAAGKPIVGVSSLRALASNIPHSECSICPMLDAKRGEVYTALYRIEKGGIPAMIVEERVTTPERLVEELYGDTLFVGDGATLYEGMIRERLSEQSFFVPQSFNYIRAGAVGLIGLKKYYDGGMLQSIGVVPRYLRASYAESKG